MDVSSAEAADIGSPKLTTAAKIHKEPNVYKKSSPDVSAVSPLGKSRYGRTRKPKITEDFYNIDVIFEAARESKRSPRSIQQVKPPISKSIKPKQQSPSKPKESLAANLKSPKVNSKPTHFVHITGDAGASENTSQESFANDSHSKAIHNFFNEESGMSLLQNAEPKTDTPHSIEAKQKDISGNVDSLAPSLSEGSLNLQSLDVTKVLKIISTKAPDPLQSNLDLKTNFKPILKTYSNKRKNFNKIGIVESFGLPDKPIFPPESETTPNEPKRIKNLDVALPSSENDINIVDKKLLDTPWKIASLNTDMTETEGLLDDFKTEDDVNALKSPIKENLVANLKYLPIFEDHGYSKPHFAVNDTKVLKKVSPRIPKKQRQVLPEKSPTVLGIEKSVKAEDKANETKFLKNRSPRKQILVVNKESSPIRETPRKKDEAQTAQTRSPRKRKQATHDDSPVVQPVNCDISVTKQNTQRVPTDEAKSPRKLKPVIHRALSEDARSPKKRKQGVGGESSENCDALKSAIKQKKELIEGVKSAWKQLVENKVSPKFAKLPNKSTQVAHTDSEVARSPRKENALPRDSSVHTASPKNQTPQSPRVKNSDRQKSPVKQKSGLEIRAELIKNPVCEEASISSKKTNKNSKDTNANETKNLKQTKTFQPIVLYPEKSPTKTILQKRKRSQSPKKPVHEQIIEKLAAIQESASPSQKIRGRPRKCPVETIEILDEKPSAINEDNLKLDTKTIEMLVLAQKEAISPVKRSSRLAKVESILKQSEVVQIDDDIGPELDATNLEPRKGVQPSNLPQKTRGWPRKPVETIDIADEESNLKPDTKNAGISVSPQKEASSPVKRSSRLAKSSIDLGKETKVESISQQSEVVQIDDIGPELDAMSLELRKGVQPSNSPQKTRRSPRKPVETIKIEDEESNLKLDTKKGRISVSPQKEASSPVKRSSRLAKVASIQIDDIGPELDDMSLELRKVLQPSPRKQMETIEIEDEESNLKLDRKTAGISVSPQKEASSPVKRSSRLAKASMDTVEDFSKEIKVELIQMAYVSRELDEMSLDQRKLLQSSVSNPDLLVAKKSLASKAIEAGEELLTDIKQEIGLQVDGNDTKTSKRKRIRSAKLMDASFASGSADKKSENEYEEMENLELGDSITDMEIKDEPDDTELGDLMWARLRGFPYWPCLVTEEPTTHEYRKNALVRNGIRRMYHVRFFGDRGRRSWVMLTSLMRFRGQDDLEKLYQEIKNKSSTSAALQSCIVKSKVQAKWANAAAEAESLKLCTAQERFDFFFNMFASEKEKKQKLQELESLRTPNPAKAEHVARSRLKSEDSLKSRSHSLPAQLKIASEEGDSKAKKGIKAKTKDDSEKEEQENKPKKLSELNLKNGSALQKRASKIKERQESHDSSVDESAEMFLKSPWLGFHVPKKGLSTPLNEANSECSLSDSDSLSKSSSNTPIPSSFKAQVLRQRRNNLFRGVPRDRVCQVCKKPGEILKCKGPCSGIFHYKCAAGRYINEPTLIIKEEPTENEEEADSKGIDMSNGLPDTTHTEDVDGKNDENPETSLINHEVRNKTDLKDNDIKDVDAPNTNKVEIIYIDCDDSDLEHTLTPKVRLTPSVDFATLSLAEQIDMKMKEVMQKLEKKTRYADSTTDYSSEESSSNLLPPAQKPKVVQKKKSLKVKHVTADHVSFASSASSEDLICESTEANARALGVSSTGATETADKQKNGEPFVNETEKHVTGDVTPRSEGSNELNFNKDDFKDFKCGYCVAEVEPPCFVCDKEVSNKNESVRQKCSLHMCGKFYHPKCLKMWPQTQWSLISTAKHKNSNKELDTFVCPVHVCHTCASDNPHAAVSRCTSDKVVKCLHCPATYHTTNYCVPAGTLILSTSQIVCPRHLGREVVKRGRVTKHSHTRTINTPWCFICSKGGDLICCETCPTSVHTDCLAINLLDDGTFICEDCETGRFPLYDEIVWVKLGTYRWWPAVILFPNEVPDNVKNIPHRKGAFVVKFFGTHDHYWVGRGRVFLFQEGDRGHCSPTKKRVDALFKKSIEEAAIAHQTKKIFKSSKEAEIKTGMKPPPYIRVKVNKPVGNVRLFDGNISNTTACECDPNQGFPCGPDSDCLNRLLLTECDPNICPAKDKCNNQRFEKRQYPPLLPYRTQARGWGLKTLAPIRKGDFVIEYVGEIIDEQEYQRRIRKMHEQKDENYYFLTIDKDRIIDAGPKGNLARFMNHCCQPNCETQKWTVNGDTRVGLFAMNDIPADAELTFNYNLECIGKEKKICKCGAPNCSGFIGVKAKQDESQKKPKKGNTNIKKKKRSLTPQVFKSDGPCFICGQNGDVGACHNKICTKFYHLRCVNLELWPEGKWVCPWHNCNVCTKRTIRCCVKCINSYCPVHSEGNVRYDKLLGFVCSEHDPTKESHELSNQNLTVKNSKNSTTVLTTEETDVTSTTSDEIDQNPAVQVTRDIQAIDLISTESVTSTPIKKKDITNFASTLHEFESDSILDRLEIPKFSIPEEQAKTKISVTAKRKRGRQRPSIDNSPKRIKLSDQVNEVAVKPKPSFAAPNLLDMPAQNEVKLSSSVPTRHLRTTRNNAATNVESKRFLQQQSELEKDLPIRKRSRPRCEATL